MSPHNNHQQEIDIYPYVETDVELAVVEAVHKQIPLDKLKLISTLASILKQLVEPPEASHSYTLYRHH